MWETFDWKTESRGQSRRKEAEGASPHQSLFIPPEESLSAWMQVPEPTLIPGWSQRGQTHSTALEQTGQRKTQSHGAAGPGRGWSGCHWNTEDLLATWPISVSSSSPFHMDTPLSTNQSSPSSKWPRNNYAFFTHEHCMLWTAHSFFHWAFSVMVNKFIQTFKNIQFIKNMMKNKTGRLHYALTKIKFNDNNSGSNNNHISIYTSREL